MKEGAAKVIWLLITPSHFAVRTASRFWDNVFVLGWVFLLDLSSWFSLLLKVNSKTV